MEGDVSRDGSKARLTVRRLRGEQWQRWRDLRLRALSTDPDAFSSTHEENLTFPEETWRQRTRAFAAAGADRVMFVAVDDPSGDWVGCAGAYVDEDGTPNLISMWVAPGHRRRGAGHSLVAAVVGWARSAGHEVLRLDVVRSQEPAVRLYTRLGFQPSGRSAPMGRDLSLIEDEMVLQLDPPRA